MTGAAVSDTGKGSLFAVKAGRIPREVVFLHLDSIMIITLEIGRRYVYIDYQLNQYVSTPVNL